VRKPEGRHRELHIIDLKLVNHVFSTGMPLRDGCCEPCLAYRLVMALRASILTPARSACLAASLSPRIADFCFAESSKRRVLVCRQ
jgi:hypothetical protein